MRKGTAYHLVIIPVVFFSLLTASSATAAGEQTGNRSSFFCRGQAPYDAQDQTRSQQSAIQDFLYQGVIQAVGKFLSPTQMGTQYAQLQQQILAQPSKYVDSYQVFSEDQGQGFYRVVGQTTISMDILRKDLEAAGFQVTDAGTNAGTSAAAGTASQGVTQPPQGNATGARGVPAKGATRGLSTTKKEVLWVVPEKWEQEWVLPTEKQDPHSLFVQSIARQLGGYDYTIQLPQAGSVKMDITGNIPPSQVTTLAETLGISEAVLGTVTYRQSQNRTAKLEVSLRVLKVGGKPGAEINKAQNMEELSNQDGAMELASKIAPQLNSSLGGGGGANNATSASEDRENTSSAKAGTWTINLPVVQYAYWQEVESSLRQEFRSLQVASLQLGSEQAVIQLEGIDGSAISRLNGTSLSNGVQIQVEAYSVETRTASISFSTKVQASPKQ